MWNRLTMIFPPASVGHLPATWQTATLMVFRPLRSRSTRRSSRGFCQNQAASAETPEYFRRVIDEAGVSLVFYDPVREPRVHRGYTAFRLDMFYDASFQYRWEDGAAGRRVTIQTEIGNLRYRISNRVELPQYLDRDDWWNNSLVRHEFDHVAMTVDPRVRMLFEHLCRNISPITRRLPRAAPVNDAVIKAIIQEEVERRYNAVIDLLIANEHALDAATGHGSRRLADRAAYFRSLLLEPNLKEHDFPFLAEVKDLLQTKAYQEAPLPYQ